MGKVQLRHGGDDIYKFRFTDMPDDATTKTKTASSTSLGSVRSGVQKGLYKNRRMVVKRGIHKKARKKKKLHRVKGLPKPKVKKIPKPTPSPKPRLNFGAMAPISITQIFMIRPLMIFRSQDHAKSFWARRGRYVFKTFEEFILHYNGVAPTLIAGLNAGYRIYLKNYLPKVPAKTRKLRNKLIQSIRASLPKAQIRFPYYMRVGINLPYASVLNRMSPPIKMKHAQYNDMEAEHQYWDKFPGYLMEAMSEGIQNAANKNGLNYKKIIWFLRSQPSFL